MDVLDDGGEAKFRGLKSSAKLEKRDSRLFIDPILSSKVVKTI